MLPCDLLLITFPKYSAHHRICLLLISSLQNEIGKSCFKKCIINNLCYCCIYILNMNKIILNISIYSIFQIVNVFKCIQFISQKAFSLTDSRCVSVSKISITNQAFVKKKLWGVCSKSPVFWHFCVESLDWSRRALVRDCDITTLRSKTQDELNKITRCLSPVSQPKNEERIIETHIYQSFVKCSYDVWVWTYPLSEQINRCKGLDTEKKILKVWKLIQRKSFHSQWQWNSSRKKERYIVLYSTDRFKSPVKYVQKHSHLIHKHTDSVESALQINIKYY